MKTTGLMPILYIGLEAMSIHSSVLTFSGIGLDILLAPIFAVWPAIFQQIKIIADKRGLSCAKGWWVAGSNGNKANSASS
jgi:hypothetical protein